MKSGNSLCVLEPKKRGRKLLSALTLAAVLPIIIVLAIPACLLIAAIGLVWSVADEALKRLDS